MANGFKDSNVTDSAIATKRLKSMARTSEIWLLLG
jgi:hypothetical protein